MKEKDDKRRVKNPPTYIKKQNHKRLFFKSKKHLTDLTHQTLSSIQIMKSHVEGPAISTALPTYYSSFVNDFDSYCRRILYLIMIIYSVI